MLASEALYFHNAPLAHVVAYEERQRERRRREHMRTVERRISRERRSGWSRASGNLT